MVMISESCGEQKASEYLYSIENRFSVFINLKDSALLLELISPEAERVFASISELRFN